MKTDSLPKSVSILTFVLATALCTAGFGQVPDTTEWTAIMGGRKAGFTRMWKNADGSISEWFQYNDRGRGDSTVARYRVNEQGLIVFLDAAGKDYFKKPVFEKFSLENGIARWENNTEKDQLAVNGAALYVPLKIYVGTSVKGYFSSPDTTLQLIPSGKQKLRILHSVKLDDGRKIYLYSTTGSGLTPSYAWMYENYEIFGSVNDWFSSLPKGYESKAEELLKIQKQYQQDYFKDLSRKLTKKLDKAVIVNASLFDPATKKVTPNTTILLENGIIKEVSTKKYKLPGDYTVINAEGKFVMPGLWDMHVHYTSETDGILHLAAGVTNVRDMGNSVKLLDRKKEVDQGIVIGPRIQGMSGFIDGAGPFAGPVGERINNVEEGKAAVKKYADLGYTQIKLYSSLKPEWVKPIAAEAKKYKMRVSGHIPAHMLALEAIDAGYNEIQHMNMIFLNFYGKELDTRTPVRFTTVAQKAAFFDFNDARFKSFVQQLKAKNITIDPTVSIFEGMFRHEEGKPNPTMEMVAQRLPLEYQRSMKSSGGLGIPNGLEETYRKSFDNMLKMLKILYDNGITIIPGTDDFAGFVLHRELENYVRAGIPPAEVLKIATLQSAQVAGRDKQYGTIEKGKVADIIIIDGNPLENIGDIRKTETIIKDDKVFSSKELYNAISIK